MERQLSRNDPARNTDRLMEYSNPEIPEGVNTTKAHPLKEFAILSVGIIGSVVLVVLVLSLLTETLATHIPFAMEEELVAKFMHAPVTDSTIQEYLQSLADQLGEQMMLPLDMPIILHYVDDDVENAFASLGGNIYIHRGLLEIISNENTLSMVIAHEIAHVQYRHPLIAMGRGVVIGLFLAAVTGLNGDRFVGSVVNKAGMITVLGFSREQEREADQKALAAVQIHYGHVSGATDLFRTLLQIEQTSSLQLPQFLSTHPLSTARIDTMEQFAREKHWSMNATTTALPYSLTQKYLATQSTE